MTDDNIVDVYSRPDVYPQYNEGRLVHIAREYLKIWEEADKSAFTEDEIAFVEKAVTEVEKQLSETVVNTAKWKDAEAELEVALVSVGLVESTAQTDAEKDLTSVLKTFNQTVNFMFTYVF